MDEATGVTSTDETVETTTEVESPTTEQTDSETTEQEVKVTEETQTEEETEADQLESEDTDLKPKSQNRFQKLANENRNLKEQIARLEQLAVPTEQDYIDGGYDPTEAKLNALEAKMQRNEAVEQIAYLNSTFDTDMVRIAHEFPLLNPRSPEYNEALTEKLFTQFDQDNGTEYSDGIVLRAEKTPYQYIKEKMDLINIASQKAKVQAQKDVEQMVAAADTPTSNAPPARSTSEDTKLSPKELAEKHGLKRVR